jgi:hypothetical protein
MRVLARTRMPPHIDEATNAVFGQQRDEFIGRSRRVSDRVRSHALMVRFGWDRHKSRFARLSRPSPPPGR